ncbi:MAG: prepilin-type N-terminal cleavage/methylation domain-containing protein [Candidatus Riflebacteria bacterium]
MKHSFKTGFTLVEICVGIAIIAGIATFYVTFISGASKESKFTADHFNAIVLSQKVVEDLIEETAVNPHGFDTLGIDAGTSNFHEVTRGSSVFFSFIEDRCEPWGKIEPGSDGMINEKMQPLYENVNKFKFAVSGERLAKTGDYEDRNLIGGKVNFVWNTQTGKGNFSTDGLFFSPATVKKTDLSIAIDQASIDSRIPAAVFGRADKTLPELAAEIGENVETLQALGRISLISREFLTSNLIKGLKQKVYELESELSGVAASNHYRQYDLRKQIAENLYELAKSCFHATAYLQPHFDELMLNGKFKDITGTGFNPITFQQDLFNYRIIYESFAGYLVQSRYYYYSLLQSNLATYKGTRSQQQTIQKLIDLYRIVAIIPSRSTGMQEHKAFVNRLKEWSEGRNPYLYRMLAYEHSLINDKSRWLEKYPNLARVDEIINQKLPPILDFIKTTTVAVIPSN